MMTRSSVRAVLGLSAAAALLPLTAACADGVEHGTVTGKDYRPAPTETRSVPRTKSRGSVCVSAREYTKAKVGEKR
ncbi:hypothetical protein ABZ686_02380 [Streptomyces sp. NPDC006992]|uniref:hypothetical protein n=1 Tax=Streptomyces sp. NPDC006992 TaxID=3155601 RepID=UPI0033FA5C91